MLEPLNLSWEVLDGIRAHSWKIEPGPATPEGMLLRFADRIAYLVHDMEDAMRAGVLTEGDLPAESRRVFGEPGRAWISTMIHAVIDESTRQGEVMMTPEVLTAMHEFREFMFDNVYLRPEANLQADKAVRVLRDLVDHYLENADEMPHTYRLAGETTLNQVLDFVSGMTDRFALRAHDRLFRPQPSFPV